MSETLQPVRGMNDVLPDDTAAWQLLERAALETFAEYGYQRDPRCRCSSAPSCSSARSAR